MVVDDDVGGAPETENEVRHQYAARTQKGVNDGNEPGALSQKDYIRDVLRVA